MTHTRPCTLQVAPPYMPLPQVATLYLHISLVPSLPDLLRIEGEPGIQCHVHSQVHVCWETGDMAYHPTQCSHVQ